MAKRPKGSRRPPPGLTRAYGLNRERREAVRARSKIENRARKARVTIKIKKTIAEKAATKKPIQYRRHDGRLTYKFRLDDNSPKEYQKLAASKMAGHDIKDLDKWLWLIRTADAVHDPRADQFRKRNKPSPQEKERDDEDDYEATI